MHHVVVIPHELMDVDCDGGVGGDGGGGGSVFYRSQFGVYIPIGFL